MSGDSTPRKRGNKRRKKDEDDGWTPPLAPGDERIHVQKDSSTGGGVIAKIIFFILFLGLLGTAAVVILEYRGTSDVDIPTEESRFGSLFAGWVDESIEKHDVSEEEEEEHEEEHEGHSGEMEEAERSEEEHDEEHDDLEELLSRGIPGVTESKEEEEGDEEGSKEEDEGIEDEEGGEEVSGEVEEVSGEEEEEGGEEEGEGLHKEHLTLPDAEMELKVESFESKILESRVKSTEKSVHHKEQSGTFSSRNAESLPDKAKLGSTVSKETFDEKVENLSKDSPESLAKSKLIEPKLAVEENFEHGRTGKIVTSPDKVDDVVSIESVDSIQEKHGGGHLPDTPVLEVDEKIIEKVNELPSDGHTNVEIDKEKSSAEMRDGSVPKVPINRFEKKLSQEFSEEVVESPSDKFPIVDKVEEEGLVNQVETEIQKESANEIEKKLEKRTAAKPEKVVELNPHRHPTADGGYKEPDIKPSKEKEAVRSEPRVPILKTFNDDIKVVKKQYKSDEGTMQKTTVDKTANEVDNDGFVDTISSIKPAVQSPHASKIIEEKIKKEDDLTNKLKTPIEPKESSEYRREVPTKPPHVVEEKRTTVSDKSVKDSINSQVNEPKSQTPGKVETAGAKVVGSDLKDQSDSTPTKEWTESRNDLNENSADVNDPIDPLYKEEQFASHSKAQDKDTTPLEREKPVEKPSLTSTKSAKVEEKSSTHPDESLEGSKMLKDTPSNKEDENFHSGSRTGSASESGKVPSKAESDSSQKKEKLLKAGQVEKSDSKVKEDDFNHQKQLNAAGKPFDAGMKSGVEMKDDPTASVINDGKQTQFSGLGSTEKIVLRNEPSVVDELGGASRLDEKVSQKYPKSQAIRKEKPLTVSHEKSSSEKEEDEGIEEGEEEEDEEGVDEEGVDEQGGSEEGGEGEEEGDEGIAEEEESSGAASQRKEEAAKVADDDDEEEEEEEEDEEEDEPPRKGRSSGEQSESLKSEPNYEKASLTNDEDFIIRQELDEAEVEIDRDPAIAVAKFSAILRTHPKSPRAFYGRARAIDRLAAKQQSNHLLGEAIDAYISLLLLPTTVLTSNGTQTTKPVHVPDGLYKAAGEECIERIRFRGHHHKAVQVHHLLEKRFPNEPRYPIQLAVTYLMENRLQNAREVLQGVLNKWPDSGSALVHMGFVLKATAGKEEDKMKQLEVAAEYLRRGIASGEEGTSDGRFFFSLGDALVRLHRREEAEGVYEDGTKRGLFLSKFQRSLYNVDHLTGKPWWTIEETTYSAFFRKMEDNWKIIRDEGLALLEQANAKKTFKDEAEDLRDVGEWKQLDLFAQGRKIQANCIKAPKTCELVSQFPAASSCTRGQIKFSVMMPGTHVWPHCGPTNCRLRSHLGLVVPAGVTIRVANHAPRTWKPGKFFVFDDSFEHEVWHNGTSPRLVLIVDVWHPELTLKERKTLPAI